ncbi:MAG TPA: chromate transporter [Patescibacteria group bacterium]
MEENKQGASKSPTGAIAQLEEFLNEYLVKKAPFAIPAGGKEFIVKIAPYLIIIFAILAIPAILVGLGLTAIFAPFAFFAGSFGTGFFLSAVFSLVAFIIELMAVPGLFARSKKGWNFAFYASLASLVGSLLAFNIVGGIIGAIIGWYILFQVKELYK